MHRCRQALHFFSAIFDCFNAFSDGAHGTFTEAARRTLEAGWLGAELLEVVSLEGLLRKFRPEHLEGWRERFERAGFLSVTFREGVVEGVRRRIQERFDPGFDVVETDGGVVLQWKGRSLLSVSSWRPGAAIGLQSW